MKKAILFLVLSVFISCNKNSENAKPVKSDSTKIIESANAVRTKINDSIRLKNNQNVFKDLSGNHQFKFTSDEDLVLKGNVNFKKTGRDLYNISGSAKSGKNTVVIDGDIHQVSEKHLNFAGKISQNINGKTYIRTKKTTFFDEGKGNFWRLQDKINGDGFIEYIDIY